MLVTFTSDAHENITMFGTVAIRLINMMGHSGTVPSAILAKDVPDALARLQQAIEQEKQKSTAQITDDDEPEVSLAHRAIPLIELLQHAVKRHADIMWKS